MSNIVLYYNKRCKRNRADDQPAEQLKYQVRNENEHEDNESDVQQTCPDISGADKWHRTRKT